jgi:cyclic pyranopterin phosphate synthase
MPAQGLESMPREHLLTYEESARVVSVMAAMGVCRVRLTGGEPTVRRGLEKLVAMLTAIEGIDEVSMTTNGHLFTKQAQALSEAGLGRINISLDSLDPEQFRAITRGGDLGRVLQSIDTAISYGLRPVKINMVVVRGFNEDQAERMIEAFGPRAESIEVRFIEWMPFEGTGGKRRHLPERELRERLGRRFRLEPLEPRTGGGPAVGWRVAESGLRIGFISPITEHFCHACNRLRLSADGHLRTCLSRDNTPNIRDLLRAGGSDEELSWALRQMVYGKVAGHEVHLRPDVSFEGVMTQIGG